MPHAKTAALADAAIKAAGGNINSLLGEYLQSFDVEAHDGRGEANFTADIAKAMRFEDHTAAIEAYRTQSKTRPLRRDGKPNRPLTGFNVAFEKVPD